MTVTPGPSASGSTPATSAPPGLLTRLLWLLVAAGVLVVGLMFSLLALVVLLVAGIAFYAVIRWQTRHLRRQIDSVLRRQPPAGNGQAAPDGRTIEGEIVGRVEYERSAAKTVTDVLSDTGSRR